MVRASALSPHQVRSGLAALKDEAASKGWPPLIWTRAYGYQLGAERAALEVCERQVVSEKLTQLRRFITGTVAPLAAAHPNDNWVRHIVAQLNSIESTLDLISSAGPPQQVTNGEEDASLPLPLRHLERRWALIDPLLPTPACDTPHGGCSGLTEAALVVHGRSGWVCMVSGVTPAREVTVDD